MKALNRAIGRTVSQLARYGREGCHPPMLMSLENHLDALLTMERKQLEVAGISIARVGDKSVVNITSTGCSGRADGKAVADWILRKLERNQAPEGMVAFSTPQEKNGSLLDRFVASGMMEQDAFREQSVPVGPGLHIDVGDVLTRTSGGQFGRWTFGADYKVIEVPADGYVTVYDDSGYPRVMSASVARSNFSVGKKQTEPAEQAQPAPVASPADEAPAPAYQVGDMLEYTGESCEYFTNGRLYPVSSISTNGLYAVHVIDDEADEHGLRRCLPEFINRGQPASQPAPDVIDMTDPRNWQVGDVLERHCQGSTHFVEGNQYRVHANDNLRVHIEVEPGESVSYLHGTHFDGAEQFFTWLRHDEAQA